MSVAGSDGGPSRARSAAGGKPKQLVSVLQRNIATLRSALREKDALLAQLIRADTADHGGSGGSREERVKQQHLLAQAQATIAALQGQVAEAQRQAAEASRTTEAWRDRVAVSLASAEGMLMETMTLQAALEARDAAAQADAALLHAAFAAEPAPGDIVAVSPVGTQLVDAAMAGGTGAAAASDAIAALLPGAVNPITGAVDRVAVAAAAQVRVMHVAPGLPTCSGGDGWNGPADATSFCMFDWSVP